MVAGVLLVLSCACANRADSPAAGPAGGGTPPATAAATPAARSAAPSAAVVSQPAAEGNAATVERMPQVRACTPTPRAIRMGSGPGQEMFSVICSNGYGLLVQCVAGSCKVMN